MRIYEIAREKNVSSKDILDLLNKAGIKVASHMSVVPDEGLAHIQKAFSPAPKPVSREKSTEKNVAQVIDKPVVEKKEEKKIFHQKTEFKKPEVIIKKTFEYSKPESTIKKNITEIEIDSGKPLFEVAIMMGKSTGDLILALLKKGMVCNRNAVLSVDTIKSLGNQFGINVILKKRDLTDQEQDFSSIKKTNKGLTRWPIVVVMGHVDHGKTTLLDFIRKKNTAAKEKGGITQHLGAYQVSSSHGDIVFLDTPGHEAFSFLRTRGTKVTDLVVLVVAADDGVMPQTIEAIKIAKSAGVPIVVAINKIDKVQSLASLQTVKRQLASQDLVVEDWGGTVVCVPISAKTGQGVDDLLEMLVLQAELMELKADPTLPAKAFVLESNIEKGYGPVATIICSEGTINKGDFFICGNSTGKIRLLIDSAGKTLTQAGPSIPVKVVGFDSFAEIGDWLRVVPAQEYYRAKSGKELKTDFASMQLREMGGESEKEKQLNLIIKTDTRGSKEAIEGSISKLSGKMKNGYPKLNIIFSEIGDISEKDIELSITTNSLLLGLHVKIEKNAVLFAKDKSIDIKLFDIIYHMVEFLQDYLEKHKELKIVYKKVAQLVVRKVFNIKKIGIVAGCYVREGVVSKGDRVTCFRGGKEIGEGKIASLQRETKSVKEVHANFECGFVCDGFQGWQEDDIVVVYAATKEPVGENN